MDNRAKRLLSLLLTISLFVLLLTVGVFAVDVPEISCELGTALDYTIPQEGGDSATGFEIVSGSLPSGLSVSLEGGSVKLVGTPGASGDYSYQIRITNASGTQEYNLSIRITEPAPTPTPTPEATPTPTPTPEVTPSPTPVPEIVITKDPTGETVMEGEYAIFIARADNADKIEWRLESGDGKISYNASEVGRSCFTQSYCEGYDEETLIIYNIPYEMNGWKAVCKFIGAGQPKFSKGAVITVNKSGLLPPSITRDPFVSSDTDTLSVTANDPNNGVLHYQWYSSADNSNANTDGTDIKIDGATSSTFVPPETPGTVYYYCAVWSTLNGEMGVEAKSRVAAVTHAAQPTPEPTPEATPEPTSSTPAPSEPTETPRQSSGRNNGSRFLLILMGVLILALIAAAVSLVIVSRKEKELEEEAEEEQERRHARKEVPAQASGAAPAAETAAAAPAVTAAVPEAAEEAPEAEPETETEEAPADDPENFVLDGWYCSKCGSFNRGRNCTACGEEKPKDAIQYVCDKCGWTNPDPAHPPRFCPNCAAPFAAADEKKE